MSHINFNYLTIINRLTASLGKGAADLSGGFELFILGRFDVPSQNFAFWPLQQSANMREELIFFFTDMMLDRIAQTFELFEKCIRVASCDCHHLGQDSFYFVMLGHSFVEPSLELVVSTKCRIEDCLFNKRMKLEFITNRAKNRESMFVTIGLLELREETLHFVVIGFEDFENVHIHLFWICPLLANKMLNSQTSAQTETHMIHDAKEYDYLIGKIDGLSERQLRAHFDLYQGYVRKINEIEDKLSSTNRAGANYSFNEASELHRRRAVAYNGVHLHELYFENLTWKETYPGEELKQAIDRSFGSLDRWAADMRAGLLSAPGWVLLTRSRYDGTLRNTLIEEHHRGVLVEQDIVLVFDGWEHAYYVDYDSSKEAYLKMLENSIDWERANSRFLRSLDSTRAWLTTSKRAA